MELDNLRTIERYFSKSIHFARITFGPQHNYLFPLQTVPSF